MSVNVSWSANEDNNVNLNLLALQWWRRKTLSGYWDLKAGRSWLFSGVYHSRLQKYELLMFPNFYTHEFHMNDSKTFTHDVTTVTRRTFYGYNRGTITTQGDESSIYPHLDLGTFFFLYKRRLFTKSIIV